jgi:hypothetical protein
MHFFGDGHRCWFVVAIAMVSQVATACFTIGEPPPFFSSDSDKPQDTHTENATESATEKTDSGAASDQDLSSDSETSMPPLRRCEDGIFCLTPPRSCDGNGNVHVHDPVGTCVNSEAGAVCDYDVLYIEECESDTCDTDDGICVSEPCRGKSCLFPPVFCKDEETLVYLRQGISYDDVSGTCRQTTGECELDPQKWDTVTCAGCESREDGHFVRCADRETLLPVACNGISPASFCDASGRLNTFEPTSGILEETDDGWFYCSYNARKTVSCGQGEACVKGRCEAD